MGKQQHPNKHPQEAVVCEPCARAGQRVEMVEQDQIEKSFLEQESTTALINLRSYRCPACEHTRVFQIA